VHAKVDIKITRALTHTHTRMHARTYSRTPAPTHPLTHPPARLLARLPTHPRARTHNETKVMTIFSMIDEDENGVIDASGTFSIGMFLLSIGSSVTFSMWNVFSKCKDSFSMRNVFF
jgi:hypothetical protein